MAADAPSPSEAPARIYRERLDARRRTVLRLLRTENRISWSRLAVAATVILAIWLAWREGESILWAGLPAAAFAVLVVVHARVIAARERAELAVRLHEAGLERMEDRWPEGAATGDRFRDERHVYAGDLDLFGPRSVFERISTARTTMGEETLAAWLLGPAPRGVALERQAAVQELAPMLDLKEALATDGAGIRAEVTPERLASWAASSPLPLLGRARATSPRALTVARIIPAVLAALSLATVSAWSSGLTGPLPFVAAVLFGSLVVLPLRPAVLAVMRGVDRRAGELRLLALMLARLERAAFRSPGLVQLRASLDATAGSAHLPPSRAIARLLRLVDLLDGRRNQLTAILVAPLFWATQLTLAIEAWRRTHGPAVVRWLSAVGEIEALCSLSTYSYEHPSHEFPLLLDREKGPVLEAKELGHPLLPARERVCNDVALGTPHPRLLLVSGSNMSGKSTLLRSVGVNVVLALAGGPVCAREMRVSPLAVGATLAISDSLQGGRSRFYAEITRVKDVVSLAAGALPALFLLDELLSGTNSHDRRIGAEAVIRSLLARGAIGLVTTHDLALADIAGQLGGALAANVHFADSLDGDRISFDYRMRPGVIEHGNALALMRAIGLEVDRTATGHGVGIDG